MICTKCKQSVSSGNAHDKYWCKSCKRACDLVYREAHREELLQKKKEYYRAHKEYFDALSAARYSANKERISEQYRQRYQDNKSVFRERTIAYISRDPERWKEYQKEYARTHVERIKEIKRDYQERNKESISRQKEDFKRAHPEIMRERSRRYRELRKKDPGYKEARNVITRLRRARLANNGGSHSVSDIRNLQVLQCNQCAFCKGDIERYYEVDHIFPVSRGGTNDPSNLQLLCQSCNRRKNNRIMELVNGTPVIVSAGTRKPKKAAETDMNGPVM